MKRMNLFKEEEDLFDLNKYVAIIEDAKLYPTKYHIESGCGRSVILIDDVVLKIPKNIGEDFALGNMQNKFEFDLYNKFKHKRLCPCIGMIGDVLVMKRIESNPNVIMNILNVTTLSEYESKIRGCLDKELYEGLNKYNVHFKDFFEFRNWGYDYETKLLQCLDYGLEYESLV